MKERDRGRGYGLPENVCAVVGAIGAAFIIGSAGVPDATMRLILATAGVGFLGSAFFIRRRVDSRQNNK